MPVGLVLSQQGTDLGPLIRAAAVRYTIPTRPIVAQTIAESNLNERAERWGAWPDVSFGLGQQTVKFARVGDRTASPANIATVRLYYFRPENAIDDLARQMAAYYHIYEDYFEAASRYNGGSRMAWADNPNRANILRGWEASAQYEQQEGPLEGFTGGFSDLADQLGRDVVGDAVEGEHQLDIDHTVQTTTKGLFWYRPGGNPLFLPAAQP